MTTIAFNYLNHKGIISERRVTVDSIEFIFGIHYGYQPGWFVSGYCHEKKARRSFALSRIVFSDSWPQDKIFKLLKLEVTK